MKKILNAFEAAGWPTSIYNPLLPKSKKGDQTIYQTVRQLNKGLKGMRFKIRGDGIVWEMV